MRYFCGRKLREKRLEKVYHKAEMGIGSLLLQQKLPDVILLSLNAPLNHG